MLVAQWKTSIQPLHVLESVDGDAPFANFAEDPLGVAIQSVERRPVEGQRPGQQRQVVVVLEAAVRLAQLDDPAPTALRTASRAYQAALDDLTQRAGIAA